MDVLKNALTNAMKSLGRTMPSQTSAVAIEGLRESPQGPRQVRMTVSTVTASAGLADPLGDLSTASQVGQISLVIPQCDDGGWYDPTPPQNGDIITFPDGRRYSVTSVEDIRGIYYRVGAHQC